MNVELRAWPRPDSATGHAFDGIADEYDERFTYSLLGRLLRQAVWRRLAASFAQHTRILDIGCGTGEDAVYLAGRGIHVVALDTASHMVEAARQKAVAAGLEDRIDVRHATMESLAFGQPQDAAFDGAYSNFGALNCCRLDLAILAAGLARRLNAGAPLVLVVMGPLVPWEWVWFLGRGQARTAFRRLRAGGLRWHGVTVRYPSLRRVRRAFAKDFRYVRASGLGSLLPPTYAENWARRHPRLTHALDRWERRLEGVPALAWLGDHYILEMERR